MTKGKFAAFIRAGKVNDQSQNDQHGRIFHFLLEIWPHEHHVYEANDRYKRRKRIQPHPEWPRKLWSRLPQNDHTNNLSKKLNKNAYDNQSRDHINEAEKTKQCRNATHHQ